MNDPYQTFDPVAADASVVAVDVRPEHIGRYRVERLLGKGGFGLVYLAHDDQLLRLVAIKVPHRRLIAEATDAEAYLAEARTVAHLDHPNIVPVFDVGSTEQFPFYVVSKYIDGTDLATRLNQSRLSIHESVDLVATIAEALHYAHKQGVVHRDIKPANILLDHGGRPYVGDFGLALREQDIGKGPRYAGTPAYMSPEQARGEGHRVDGRCDIFSLGVVLYELLTGRLPFKADSHEELLEQIIGMEVRPLRQLDENIPKELERVCLKVLSKRASDRSSTAQDLVDDLRLFLTGASTEQAAAPTGQSRNEANVTTPVPSVTPARSDAQPVRIVPKGLRSFDAGDADFFLELLPGARDRDGLPESIRFWKSRIETTDADSAFAVGLIYGPSGCGKSSLVKAGLLPRLGKWITTVYVEATAVETESRLLKGLRRQVGGLPANLGLIETLTALRRGRYLQPNQKVLLVLDQFEQWLHSGLTADTAELVQALRQCDGGRVQCVVMVRDDFWMAVSRFFKVLEIELTPGRNIALVDFFEPRHAREVLTAFGRAFGVLPEFPQKPSKEQSEFLDKAIAGLAEEGKLNSVRLALFAELVKGKNWVPETLREVGGIEGIGVTFLDDTFSSASAIPKHRLHEKAVRGVLKALLPDSNREIKGAMRSDAQLTEASGYANRPRDFDDLMRILDSEVRLVTPTDPEAQDAAPPAFQKGVKYYQLTHDYLVPSLQDWLTRKQKETRRGRAELLLADRAQIWNMRRENRQLPSLPQWLQLKFLTATEKMTAPEKMMMKTAGRYHALRSAALGLLLLAAIVAGLKINQNIIDKHKETIAAGSVQSLLNAKAPQVPAIIKGMADLRQWADPILRVENQRALDGSPQKLNTSLALLPVDPSQVEFLYMRLLEARPDESPVLLEALAPHQEALRPRLWAVATTTQKVGDMQRLHAAAALAAYDATNPVWADIQDAVADDLTNASIMNLETWVKSFWPVRTRLIARLKLIFRNTSRPEQGYFAAYILAEYLSDQPSELAELLVNSDERQFEVIYPKLKEHAVIAARLLNAEVERTFAPSPAVEAVVGSAISFIAPDQKRAIAKRQANAGAALLCMGLPGNAWSLLKHGSDPTARTYLIHKFSPLRVPSAAIVERLNRESDETIRQALLLGLGEYDHAALSLSERADLIPTLRDLYRTANDPGLHAALEWLLRSWGQVDWLRRANDELRGTMETRLGAIQERLGNDKVKARRAWYVNSQGQTMIVLPGPKEFGMGSPSGAQIAGFYEEKLHSKKINRTFAISAKPVTVAQYRRGPDRGFNEWSQRFPTASQIDDCPVAGTTWFEAAAYCNWLSRQEGLDPCYKEDENGKITEIKGKYLSKNGYRLPTSAEWEYACRAGSTTSRYYGNPEETFLAKYGWYLENSQEHSWPVGSLKPNDYGLFDMHGNVWNWCQERFFDFFEKPDRLDDEEDILTIDRAHVRLLRGGAFDCRASIVRSAYRNDYMPEVAARIFNCGFRPVRTLTPASD